MGIPADFLEKIYRYAESLKKSPLTQEEKDKILNEFYKLGSDPFTNAVESVHKVLRRSIVESDLTKSANLDNTRRLLSDIKDAASKWGKK